ncbi:MAG: hypothetical protein GY791_08660 [Alphaproteobacteria bacterium]|nr:hypothetical protein [Alphaproteobacteria bacterium]
MNERTHKRFGLFGLGVLALVSLLAACTYERSQVAKDARTELIGKSRGDILACAGRPKTTIKDGDLEYFAYYVGNPDYDRVLGVQPTEAQKITGSALPKNCKVRIMFRNGIVETVSYSGNTGGIITRGEVCASVVSRCVSSTSD